jgi:hypothetical protein
LEYSTEVLDAPHERTVVPEGRGLTLLQCADRLESLQGLVGRDDLVAQESVGVDAVPLEARPSHALLRARHDEAHLVEELSPGCHEPRRAVNPYHEELTVVCENLSHVKGALVRAQLSASVEVSAPHWVRFRRQDGCLLRVKTAPQHPEEGVGKALRDSTGRVHAEPQYVGDDPCRHWHAAVGPLEPHEAGFVDLRGVEPELVEVEFDVVRNDHQVLPPKISSVPQDRQVVGLLSESGLHFRDPNGPPRHVIHRVHPWVGRLAWVTEVRRLSLVPVGLLRAALGDVVARHPRDEDVE